MPSFMKTALQEIITPLLSLKELSTVTERHTWAERYREIRETCLVSSLRADDSENLELGELARFLRALSGLYDQAARAATSL